MSDRAQTSLSLGSRAIGANGDAELEAGPKRQFHAGLEHLHRSARQQADLLGNAVKRRALPSWLTFNAATGNFSGKVPAGASTLSLKVSATDTYGLSASEIFTLAQNTFTDPQGEVLTYAVSQANGAALPSWLKFNATTDTFTGTSPTTATALSLKVTATDAGGALASETFGVTISTKASSFVQAIASLSRGGSATPSLTQAQTSHPQTLASPLG
jgi:hypothetical protein